MTTPAAGVAPGLLDALAGAGELLTDPDLLASYRADQAAPGLLVAGTPAAVVRPTTTAQVQAAVRAAAAHGAPVVARGAGSGLSGGANAIDGCVVVSLERMARIVDVDPDALTATVEPGVVNAALREAAATEALLYAPDPASAEFSTIGGNVATNAGGLCCVKYGVTRDALLALEVVLADGRAVRVGHRTRKGVTGYDLAGLLCGSEGTLGIIPRATVRLRPLPRPADHRGRRFPEAAMPPARRIARSWRPASPPVAAGAHGPGAAIAAVEQRRADGARPSGPRPCSSRAPTRAALGRRPRSRRCGARSAKRPAPTSS